MPVKPYYEQDGITIYRADCREILPSLSDKSVDFIFTDPPYGHTENGSLAQRREAVLGWQDGEGVYRDPMHHGRMLENDGREANDLIRLVFSESNRLLRPGCCCCCCGGGGGPDPQFARWSLWMDEHLDFKQMVVWDKGPIGMGWHYRRSYETVLVGQKAGGKCRWYDETDRIENIIRHIPKIIPNATDHPTPKPDALIKHFMRLHATQGDLVLDPFMGHGGVLDAARLHGCQAIGIEIEERYCEIAANRLSQGVLPFANTKDPQ
jgi:site-specific DNA-methyltransferase (adenine-specific)